MAAAASFGDRFEFAVERSQTAEDLPGGGQRWTVIATLAGREFERRATHPVPHAVPLPPGDWEPGWRKLAAHVPADDDVHHGHATAASLLDPVLNHELTSGTWDPDIGKWHEA